MLGGEVGRRRAIVFARIAVFLREAMVLYLGSSDRSTLSGGPLSLQPSPYTARLLGLPFKPAALHAESRTSFLTCIY